MRTLTKIAIATFALASVPTVAQSEMPGNGATQADRMTEAKPKTEAERARKERCKAMTHEAAMADANCKTFIMKEGGADNHNGTPHGAPTKPAN